MRGKGALHKEATGRSGVQGVRELLQECYATITELKETNRLLEEQLKQKDTIIDRLIREKQEHILHLATCQGETLKKQLESARKKNEQMRMSFEASLQSYEQLARKQEHELEKLKGFNKVLRMENSHFREGLKHSKAPVEKRIGKIVETKREEQPAFAYTVNRWDGLEMSQQKQAITPQKLTTSKSVNLASTASKSNSNPFSNSKPQSKGKGRSLFNNSVLKQQLDPETTFPSTTLTSPPPFHDKIVGLWFSKLRHLLADSDEE